MATTITQAFNTFASNLEITDRQTKLVSTRRQNVVNAIGAELALHPITPSLVIGSYDRNTLIRYLSEGDVDVLVILNYGKNSDWDSAEGTIRTLDRFKTILDKAYPNTEKGRDRNCITMQFSEFRLDVVPAFMVDDGLSKYYKIPDSVRRMWVLTDPIQFAAKVTGINSTMDRMFVPLIKMVKGWNRDKSWPIRSFHLECMMYDHFKSYTTGYSYPYMLKEFFASLASRLSFPSYDPVRGDQVDTYMDNGATKTRRQIAIEKAQDAAAKSREAYEDQDKYSAVIAIQEWKALMGEFFPNYG